MNSFLVILSQQIPPEFLKYFNGVLPYNSTITTLEGRSWKVELNKFNDSLCFHGGWHQFVLDNSLEFGDFLIFYYGGNAKFYVKIYGRNGCLKEPNAPTSNIRRAISFPPDNRSIEQSKSLDMRMHKQGWCCDCKQGPIATTIEQIMNAENKVDRTSVDT